MKKIEKQVFYISEFEQEAAWLAFMQKEGWKFVSTTGRQYEFESCEPEEWVYQLDFKEKDALDEDYIQMYTDFGWEYVFHYKNWFYFRKKREDGETENLSIFSDNESKIDMCKRVINGQFMKVLPLYALMLVYDYLLFFTGLLKGETFWHGLALGIGTGSMLIIVFSFGYFIGQYMRLDKTIKSLENPIQ